MKEALGRIAILGVLVATAGIARGQTPQGTPDARADPWADEANPAADQPRQPTVEQSARARCAILLQIADRAARSPSPADQQSAPTARSNAAKCLQEARAYFQRQADEQARMAAFFEQKRAEAARAEKARQESNARAQAAQEARARQEAANEAAEQAESEARLKDPAFMRAELSAVLCYVASSRKHAKGMIDNERQGARQGLGIIDKQVVHEWQEELVTMSKLERLARDDLKARKATPLACKPAAVAEFSDCIAEARGATLLLNAGDDEYLADAKRIMESGPSCTPWKRLTAPVSADAPAAATP